MNYTVLYFIYLIVLIDPQYQRKGLRADLF